MVNLNGQNTAEALCVYHRKKSFLSRLYISKGLACQETVCTCDGSRLERLFDSLDVIAAVQEMISEGRLM